MPVPATVAMELLDALDARVNDFLTPMSPRELRAALADLRAAQRAAPAGTLGALFGMIGSVCFRLHDFQDALDAYRNAARYEKMSAEYPCNAAICLVELERFREALDCLRDAHGRPQKGPGVDVSILVNMADARHYLGDDAAARSCFEEALKRLDPTSARDLFNVADAAATLGADDDAVEFFARCLSVATGVPLGETPALEFIRESPDHLKAVLAEHATLERAFAAVGARHDASIPEEHQIHARIALAPAALTSLFDLVDHPPEPTEALRNLLNAPRP
jgi:tetratricopeptide (TPR) repeat protein